MKELSKFERALLAAIGDGEKAGLEIVVPKVGMGWIYRLLRGVPYTELRNLASYGLVAMRRSGPLEIRGGLRRTYFRLTDAGREEMKKVSRS